MKRSTKTAIFLILCISLFLVSCSADTLSSEFEQRLEILYSHTLEMERLSTKEQLIQIGLDTSYLEEGLATTMENKISQLEQSYQIETTGSYEERILQLEESMALMMYQWAMLGESSS